MGGESRSITALLTAWGRGDTAALEQLTPRVYLELRKVADAYLRRGHPGQALQPTALVNEAYVRLLDQEQPSWENRAHFFGIAAKLMRMTLVDEARTRAAAKRGGGAVAVTLHEWDGASPAGALDVLEVHEALNRLAEVDERKARVIELRYFTGLDREEVAEALGLTLATVKRDLRLGEAWLRRFLGRQGQTL